MGKAGKPAICILSSAALQRNSTLRINTLSRDSQPRRPHQFFGDHVDAILAGHFTFAGLSIWTAASNGVSRLAVANVAQDFGGGIVLPVRANGSIEV